MKLTTTLTKIRSCSPCQSGWRTLLKHLGEDFDPDTEINLLTILEANGVADMLWTLRATNQDSKQVSSQLAIEFAELALPIFKKRYPDDARPRLCIQAARDYNEGKISREELQKARAAAYTAADAAYTAAADAAYTAAAAAADADTADAAYGAAAYAADAAAAYADAAYTAADAAREEMRAKQATVIRMVLEA